MNQRVVQEKATHNSPDTVRHNDEPLTDNIRNGRRLVAADKEAEETHHDDPAVFRLNGRQRDDRNSDKGTNERKKSIRSGRRDQQKAEGALPAAVAACEYVWWINRDAYASSA